MTQDEHGGGLISEWSTSMTRIGNLLGLPGRFLVDFGFQQIEAKIDQKGSAKQPLTITKEVGAEAKRLLRIQWHRLTGRDTPPPPNSYSINTAILTALGYSSLHKDLITPFKDFSLSCKEEVLFFAKEHTLRTQLLFALRAPELTFARIRLFKGLPEVGIKPGVYQQFLSSDNPTDLARGVSGFVAFLNDIVFQEVEEAEAFIDLCGCW